MIQSSGHREFERKVEDFILAAGEETLQRLQALIEIRSRQIGSPLFDRETQRMDDTTLQL